jgi:hypothetical protein
LGNPARALSVDHLFAVVGADHRGVEVALDLLLVLLGRHLGPQRVELDVVDDAGLGALQHQREPVRVI